MTLRRPCAVLWFTGIVLAACSEGTAWIGSNARDASITTTDDAQAACSTTDTDPDNCGACGHRCLGAPCTAGVCTPETIAAGPGSYFALASDDAYIYWSDFALDGGSLWRAPLAGGPMSELAPQTGEVHGITRFGANLLFSTYDKKIVGSVPASGGTITVLATATGPTVNTAVDGTYLYWALDGRSGSPTVARMPLSGGAQSALLTGRAATVLAVDGDDLYFADVPRGEIVRIPKSGGAETVVASGQAYPYGLAVDATYVYWGNYDSGTVMRARRSGGVPEVVADGQAHVNWIVVDGDNLYWTLEEGDVMKRPGNGAMYPIARRQAGKMLLVVGPYIYWTNMFADSGSIMRVAK